MISGVTLPLIEQMLVYRETLSSAEFRERIVELGAPEVSSLWHQQQKIRLSSSNIICMSINPRF